VHRELGPGLLETVYEVVLARELTERGLKVVRQAPGAGVYADGTQVPVSAAPASGWRFKGWGGTGIADTNALETAVLMDADKSVSACFELRPPSRTTVLFIR